MSALTDTFTAIANAIRVKLGVSTTYTPAQMASAIASIPKAVLQSKSTNVTPSANWSGTNTNYATVTPDSGYDGMSQLQVSVPMLRDNTLMEADAISTPGTVYNGNTSQSNSQQLLRMHPTKDGMSYTGSYLFLKPNSYLGNASASDVLSGKTFSSSNGIQITGTGSGGTTPTVTTLYTWSDSSFTSGAFIPLASLGTDFDYHRITFVRGSSDASEMIIIVPTKAWSGNPYGYMMGFQLIGTTNYYARYFDIWKEDGQFTISFGYCRQYNDPYESYVTTAPTYILPRKWEGLKLNI